MNYRQLIIFLIGCMYILTTSLNAGDYKDPSLPVEIRARDLISRMTLEEKISQMMSDAPAIERLNVKKYYWWNECLHGVARNGIATVFPQAIGLAATWDPESILQVANVISTEARAKYKEAVQKESRDINQGLTMWSPNINLFRDPRWGRGQETYGEDPWLISRIAIAFVKGLQGDHPKYFKVISTPKHYAVHSGPENLRHSFDAVVSKKDLFDTYLPAFESCIREAEAWSVMGAYNQTNGEPCCASPYLLQKILRDKWGFKGYVVSDCGAIGDIFYHHKKTADLPEASAMAVKAGCDLDCGSEYTFLVDAVEGGLISEEEIDQAVIRLMTARFKLGMFDPDEMVPYTRIPVEMNDTPEHNQLALKAARESIVLLKNQKSLLPFDKSIKTISVIGPYADNVNVLLGNYNGTPSNPVTFLQGIKNKVSNKARVIYAKGVKLLEGAGEFKVIDANYLSPDKSCRQHGLLGEYFDNAELRGEPIFKKVDKKMDSYWDLVSPREGIPSDSFSVRWTGFLEVKELGEYELGIVTDDKGRLYFDGKLLVDNWEPFEINIFKYRKVFLKEGKNYPIRMEYADLGDYAGIRLKWRKIPAHEEEVKLTAEAVKVAEKSDVVIFVGGISSQLEGEEMPINIDGFKGGDRTNLKLPGNQRQLLKKLYQTGKPIVLVLTGGSALAVNWAEENIPAILMAWYPGQRGGDAIADILFGDYNPAGRLPVTFYYSVDDLPPFEDYSMKGRTYRYYDGKVLYPFGFGLSFTNFEYQKLKVPNDEIKSEDKIKIYVTVENTGSYDGEEVVQLYVKGPQAGKMQPLKELKAFKRVVIQKGKTKIIELGLNISDLRTFSEVNDDYIILPGKYGSFSK